MSASANGVEITARKRMEEELRETDRKKDDFIALLAHELRNPLAPIRNGLQIIRLSNDRGMRDQSQQMMDRPHIILNERTGKYVCWLKIMGKEYADTQASTVRDIKVTVRAAAK